MFSAFHSDIAGTNIYESMMEGLKLLNNDRVKPLTSMLLFLTDGLATVGIKDKDKIVRDISDANAEAFSIHCVAFGNDADYELMKRLSTKNFGLARKIYADSDADVQLEGSSLFICTYLHIFYVYLTYIFSLHSGKH